MKKIISFVLSFALLLSIPVSFSAFEDNVQPFNVVLDAGISATMQGKLDTASDDTVLKAFVSLIVPNDYIESEIKAKIGFNQSDIASNSDNVKNYCRDNSVSLDDAVNLYKQTKTNPELTLERSGKYTQSLIAEKSLSDFISESKGNAFIIEASKSIILDLCDDSRMFGSDSPQACLYDYDEVMQMAEEIKYDGISAVGGVTGDSDDEPFNPHADETKSTFSATADGLTLSADAYERLDAGEALEMNVSLTNTTAESKVVFLDNEAETVEAYNGFFPSFTNKKISSDKVINYTPLKEIGYTDAEPVVLSADNEKSTVISMVCPEDISEQDVFEAKIVLYYAVAENADNIDELEIKKLEISFDVKVQTKYEGMTYHTAQADETVYHAEQDGLILSVTAKDEYFMGEDIPLYIALENTSKFNCFTYRNPLTGCTVNDFYPSVSNEAVNYTYTPFSHIESMGGVANGGLKSECVIMKTPTESSGYEAGNYTVSVYLHYGPLIYKDEVFNGFDEPGVGFDNDDGYNDNIIKVTFNITIKNKECDFYLSSVGVSTASPTDGASAGINCMLRNSSESVMEETAIIDFYVDGVLFDSVEEEISLQSGEFKVISSEKKKSLYFGTHTIHAEIRTQNEYVLDSDLENNKIKSRVKVSDA